MANEEKTTLEKIPAKAAEAIKHHAAGNPITGVSKETEDKQTVYEGAIQTKHGIREVSVDAEGKLVSDEQTIQLSEAPGKVQAAVNEKTAGGKLEKLEKVQEKGETTYEALVTTKEGRAELVFAADGKLLKTEKKGAKED